MIAVMIGSGFFVNMLILEIDEQFKIIVMFLKPNVDFFSSELED